MTQPTIEPTEPLVRAMLKHFAWQRANSTGENYELWALQGGRLDGEVLVPTDSSRGDYAMLLRRAWTQLSRMHGVAAEHFVSELSVRRAGILDSTRWRKETAVPAGLIAWGEGRALYESAQLQLIAAAKASREPRRHHGNASSWVAKRFLEQTLMGQTDVGSFVITALTPAESRIHLTKRSEASGPGNPRDLETVSGRSILSTYAGALEAIRSGLDDYIHTPRHEVFAERVEAGVSHEMMKALSAFTLGGESAVQIELEGAGDDSAKIVEFDFKPTESTVLDRVSQELADEPAPRPVTLWGEVIVLQRDHEQSARVIRLDVPSGIPVRKARVRLTPEQYQVALEAHREERYIQVSGTLEKERNLYWLYGARDISILEGAGPTKAREPIATRDAPLDLDWDADEL